MLPSNNRVTHTNTTHTHGGVCSLTTHTDNEQKTVDKRCEQTPAIQCWNISGKTLRSQDNLEAVKIMSSRTTTQLREFINENLAPTTETSLASVSESPVQTKRRTTITSFGSITESPVQTIASKPAAASTTEVPVQTIPGSTDDDEDQKVRRSIRRRRRVEHKPLPSMIRRSNSSEGEGDGLREDPEVKELPQPLTRTNVTLHDRIWSRDDQVDIPNEVLSAGGVPREGSAGCPDRNILEVSDESTSEYSCSSQDTTVFNGPTQPIVAQVETLHSEQENATEEVLNQLVGATAPTSSKEVVSNNGVKLNKTDNPPSRGVLMNRTRRLLNEDDDGYESTDNMSTGSNASSSSSANSVPNSSSNNAPDKQPSSHVKHSATSSIVKALASKLTTEHITKSPTHPITLNKVIPPRINIKDYSTMVIKPDPKTVSHTDLKRGSVNVNQVQEEEASTSTLSEDSKTIVREHFIKPGDVILACTRTYSVNDTNVNGAPTPTKSIITESKQKPKSILKKDKRRKKVSFNLPTDSDGTSDCYDYSFKSTPEGVGEGDIVNMSSQYNGDTNLAASSLNGNGTDEVEWNEPHGDECGVNGNSGNKSLRLSSNSEASEASEFVENRKGICNGEGDVSDTVRDHESFSRQLAGIPLSYTEKLNKLEESQVEIVQRLQDSCKLSANVLTNSEKFSNRRHYDTDHYDTDMKPKQYHPNIVRNAPTYITTRSTYISTKKDSLDIGDTYGSDYVNHDLIETMYDTQPSDTVHTTDRENIEIVHQHLQKSSRPSTVLTSVREQEVVRQYDPRHAVNAAPVNEKVPEQRYYSLERPRKNKTVAQRTQDDLHLPSPTFERKYTYRDSFNNKHHPTMNEPNYRHSFAGPPRVPSPQNNGSVYTATRDPSVPKSEDYEREAREAYQRTSTEDSRVPPAHSSIRKQLFTTSIETCSLQPPQYQTPRQAQIPYHNGHPQQGIHIPHIRTPQMVAPQQIAPIPSPRSTSLNPHHRPRQHSNVETQPQKTIYPPQVMHPRQHGTNHDQQTISHYRRPSNNTPSQNIYQHHQRPSDNTPTQNHYQHPQRPSDNSPTQNIYPHPHTNIDPPFSQTLRLTQNMSPRLQQVVSPSSSALFAKTSDIYKLMQSHGKKTQTLVDETARPVGYHPSNKNTKIHRDYIGQHAPETRTHNS